MTSWEEGMVPSRRGFCERPVGNRGASYAGVLEKWPLIMEAECKVGTQVRVLGVCSGNSMDHCGLSTVSSP